MESSPLKRLSLRSESLHRAKGKTAAAREEFAEGLLHSQQVAVIPGDAFGPSGAGYVRACYASSLDKIEAALDRILDKVHEHGMHTLTGREKRFLKRMSSERRN